MRVYRLAYKHILTTVTDVCIDDSNSRLLSSLEFFA